MAPKISIISPSRNNGPYVGAFIESILAQTEQDFELVMVDDASTDDNLKVIESYKDPRIKVFRHPYHQGLNAGINHAIEQCTAPIIAKIDSDDMAEPDYIERVLQAFKDNPAAGSVYVSLCCIDENNNPLPRKFNLDINMDRQACLRTIFFVKNCLTSPGMAFKKDIIEPYLPLAVSVLQYTDSFMHVPLLLHNETVLLSEYLIKYRRQSFKSAKNISARSSAVQKRATLEVQYQMDNYLHIENAKLLKDIFGNHAVLQKFPPEDTTIPFVLGMLALTSAKQPKKIWGYRQVARFIDNPDNFDLVNKLYGFNFAQFINLINESDIEIIVNKSSIRLIRFLRKLYAPYDNFRRMIKAKRKVS